MARLARDAPHRLEVGFQYIESSADGRYSYARIVIYVVVWIGLLLFVYNCFQAASLEIKLKMQEHNLGQDGAQKAEVYALTFVPSCLFRPRARNHAMRRQIQRIPVPQSRPAFTACANLLYPIGTISFFITQRYAYGPYSARAQKGRRVILNSQYRFPYMSATQCDRAANQDRRWRLWRNHQRVY